MRAPIRERWVWRREAPRVRQQQVNSLTDEQEENVRRALRHLAAMHGSLKYVAESVGMAYQTARHAMVKRRPVSVGVAFRTAQAAGVPMEDVVSGAWPGKDTPCSLCGRRG